VGTIKTSQGFVVACVLNALRIIYLMTCFISESFHTHEQLTSSSRAAHEPLTESQAMVQLLDLVAV